MGQRTFWRWLTATTAALCLAATQGWALVRFDDGNDQIFVNTSLSVAYDSNIFASNGGSGDVLTTTSLSLEYTRRAGYIGINASAAWNLGRFDSNTGQDFSNPALHLELVKGSGRTTGTLTLDASRNSSADTTVNMRTDSWNYLAGLNWKYPVIDRYSLSGGFNYGLTTYEDPAPGIYNLTTYGSSLDLFYAYTSARDLIAGYAVQFSDSGAGTRSIDHSFTVGVSGKILAKVNGTVRAGYQLRQQQATGETFGSWTASASSTWNLNRRVSFTATLSKAFTTSAADSTVDNLAANLDMQYALRARWSLYAGIGGGKNDFLSGSDAGRRDYYLTWSTGVNYSLNDHFKASLTYSYFQNWSNRSSGVFDRQSVTLNLSSRW